jgi:hypothetical protein
MRLGGHSADVQIALHINGHSIRVAKMGPRRLYLSTPQMLSAPTGEVVMHVDGHERRWRVRLSPTSRPTQVIDAEFEPAS